MTGMASTNTELETAGLDWANRGTSHIDFKKEETVPLQQGRFLGYGVNGGVYETVVQGLSVAWKRRFCRGPIGIGELREIEILKKLRHRHIIKLLGTYTHESFLGLLLWPVAVCDLATFLEDVDNLLSASTFPDNGAYKEVDYQTIIDRFYQ